MLWGACGLAVLGVAADLVVPIGGENRLGGAVVPLAVSAVALAVLARLRHLDRWFSLILYAVPALGLTYGMMAVASVPIRLAIVGTCPASGVCPVGYDHPLASRESVALYLVVACGLVALLLTLMALELQFQPRLRLLGRARPAEAQPASAPAPPPEMRPSAIVRKPAPAAPVQDGGGKPDP